MFITIIALIILGGGVVLVVWYAPWFIIVGPTFAFAYFISTLFVDSLGIDTNQPITQFIKEQWRELCKKQK